MIGDYFMSPSLNGADAWLTRAEVHLQDFEVLVRPLIKMQRETVMASVHRDFRDDPPVLHQFGYNAPKFPAPDGLSVLVGECVQALRRCLDYLAFELIALDSGNQPKGSQFPIEKDKAAFQGQLKRKRPRKTSICCRRPAASPGRLKGLRPEHAALIEDTQPYKGGTWLKVLQGLSNPDKHRQLLVTASAYGSWLTPQRPLKNYSPLRKHGWDRFTAIIPFESDVHVKLEVTMFIGFENGTQRDSHAV